MKPSIKGIRTESGDLQIDYSALANVNIATEDIADSAVGTSKIKNGAVTTGKIANGAVTSAKVDSTVATTAYVNSVKTTAEAALPKSGGTLSGDLFIGDKTNTEQLDLYIRRVISESLKSGRLYWGDTGILRLQAASADSVFNYMDLAAESTEFKRPVSLQSGGTGATSAAGALTKLGALPTAGGTMTGPINMGSKRITNLPALTSDSPDSDAATKGYVDGKRLSSATSGTVTLTTSGWSSGAQTVDVTGILATDMPHWGVVYGTDTEAEKEAFAMVDVLETSAGKFTFRCFGDVPAVALTIQWEVNR